MPSDVARPAELTRPQNESGRAAHHLVSTIAAYVRMHYARDITNGELAGLIGVSPS